MTTARGHRAVPHPSDLTIEAWGPTREACLTEALTALVESFADTTRASRSKVLVFDLPAHNDRDRLVAVLDHVIYLLDTEGVIPLGAEVDVEPQTLRLSMSVTSIDDTELIGAAPKGVALSGLQFGRVGDNWGCRVTIDV